MPIFENLRTTDYPFLNLTNRELLYIFKLKIKIMIK